MKFTDLYNTGIVLWPNEIYIGDGYPTGKSGYLFKELTKIYDEIEDQIDIEDGWAQIIVWSMFQAFHTESKKLIKSNKKILKPKSVENHEIEKRVLNNLKGEGWESLLAEYKDDLKAT